MFPRISTFTEWRVGGNDVTRRKTKLKLTQESVITWIAISVEVCHHAAEGYNSSFDFCVKSAVFSWHSSQDVRSESWQCNFDALWVLSKMLCDHFCTNFLIT